MSIKGVIIDYSNTLVAGNGVVPGMAELVKGLRDCQLGVAVVSNNKTDASLLNALGISVALTPAEVGNKKPSPDFVKEVARRLNILPQEIVYVGDDWRTDARCAANAGILYYHAAWGKGDFRYGLKVHSPEAFLAIVRTFFLPLKGWAWAYQGVDRLNRRIEIRSVISSRVGSMYDVAKRVFTYETASQAEVEFFFHTLVAGLTFYADVERGQLWTTYPSHTKGSDRNVQLHQWLTFFAKEFYCDMYPLLVRHQEALDSSKARGQQRQSVPFSNQVHTVHLSSDYKSKLRGRTVVVIDDFTTSGKSLEWARNLLLKAGADRVLSVTLGKIGNSHEIYTPRFDFDPFAPCHLSDNDFNCQRISVSPLAGANSFDIAFRAWSKWHTGDPTITILVKKQ